jgi:hypothetical protein
MAQGPTGGPTTTVQPAEIAMSKKFDPAPVDKHAANPKQATRDDKKKSSKLEEGLEESFPASDPASSTSPTKSD